jgi:hypothetical protein
MPRAKRQPLRAVRNGVQAKAEEAPKPVVSVALKKAIDTMDDTRLRMWVKHYCESNELLRKELEKSLLVPGKDIVRYHADSDSEDKEMENGDEEEKEEKNKRPIVIDDEETTSRFAKCDHCGEEFDITENEKGDCIWHPGLSIILRNGGFPNRIQGRRKLMTMTLYGMTSRSIGVILVTMKMIPNLQMVLCGLVVRSVGTTKVASRQNIKPIPTSLSRNQQLQLQPNPVGRERLKWRSEGRCMRNARIATRGLISKTTRRKVVSTTLARGKLTTRASTG